MRLSTGLAMTVAVAFATPSSNAAAQHEGHGASGDSAAVAATVASYHEALAAGDSTGALRGAVLVRIRGDVAWASSTSTTQGETNGRTINSAGAELMVLVRTAQGWKIAAIHWSSRNRRPQS